MSTTKLPFKTQMWYTLQGVGFALSVVLSDRGGHLSHLAVVASLVIGVYIGADLVRSTRNDIILTQSNMIDRYQAKERELRTDPQKTCPHPNSYHEGSLGYFCTECNAPVD